MTKRTSRTDASTGYSVAVTKTTANGESKTTFGDGTVVTLRKAPDTRFLIGVPIPEILKVETGGKTFEMKATRDTTWDDADPFSMTERVDTLEFREGLSWRTFTNTFEAASGPNLATHTTVTPVGRTRYTRLDANGRLKEDELLGLGRVVYDYDGDGRLWKITHKHVVDALQDRVVELLYDASGRLWKIKDPYGVEMAVFGYDNANRPTSVTEPGAVATGFGYDANGNTTSVTRSVWSFVQIGDPHSA